MAHRTLIVAYMKHDDADAVANIFAASDATDLPRRIGVQRRTLFRFRGLYLHLVEAEEDITSGLYRARSSELYQDINRKLAVHSSTQLLRFAALRGLVSE